MTKTNAERQRAFRERMRDRGLTRIDVWCQPDDIERIRDEELSSIQGSRPSLLPVAQVESNVLIEAIKKKARVQSDCAIVWVPVPTGAYVEDDIIIQCAETQRYLGAYIYRITGGIARCKIIGPPESLEDFYCYKNHQDFITTS